MCSDADPQDSWVSFVEKQMRMGGWLDSELLLRWVAHKDRGHQEIIKIFAEITCGVGGFIEREKQVRRHGEPGKQEKGNDSCAKRGDRAGALGP